MLTKLPKPSYRRYIKNTAKVLFVAEALAFAVSFGVWYRLNTERDFRLFMNKNCTWVLEGYYSLGEKLADIKTRESDKKIWEQEGKL